MKFLPGLQTALLGYFISENLLYYCVLPLRYSSKEWPVAKTMSPLPFTSSSYCIVPSVPTVHNCKWKLYLSAAFTVNFTDSSPKQNCGSPWTFIQTFNMLISLSLVSFNRGKNLGYITKQGNHSSLLYHQHRIKEADGVLDWKLILLANQDQLLKLFVSVYVIRP